nr:proline racemase family protein [Rhodovulum sulfidophilum]
MRDRPKGRETGAAVAIQPGKTDRSPGGTALSADMADHGRRYAAGVLPRLSGRP